MRKGAVAVLWLLVAVGDALPLYFNAQPRPTSWRHHVLQPPASQLPSSLLPGNRSPGFGGSSSDGIPGIKRFSAKPLHADRFEETLCWAVKLQTKGEHHGRALAQQLGVTFVGAVGDFGDVHVVCHATSERPLGSGGGNLQQHLGSHRHLSLRNSSHFSFIQGQLESRLDGHLAVQWYNREVVRQRQKRHISFSDPYFPRQWHLRNKRLPGMDINVTGVWERGVTGQGVTVAVVDDGVEWDNPDLKDNYNSAGSWDLNDEDPDPMPSAGKDSNHHGTRCAGEIAAVPNKVCGVGVAHGAKFSGLRVLDGPMTDSLEASAFNKRLQVNDIFSCSWGPDDDGRTVDGPHIMAAKAMKYGVDYGRRGYGSIFVVASGNGGRQHDNCNYDGYANSIYTVTIGAVDEQGHMPFYAEECASMLGVTFSSGTMEDRDIVTTDWRKRGGTGCTERHTGTSAAAPLAAGMIALVLQARPCLTWRDVQYLIAMTAVKVDVDEAHWQRNGAGLEHSHKHGFGLLKAWRMVNAAKVWEPVPWMTSFLHSQSGLQRDIPPHPSLPLTLLHTVTEADIDGYDLAILEQVQVTVTLTHPRRGWLEIRLTSPSGTLSTLGAPRPLDNSSAGFTEWSFTTVRCWGETPVGVWNLTIRDTGSQPHTAGVLKSWGLHLFGSPMTPEDFQRRRRDIEEAMDGKYLNSSFQLPCPSPPVTASPDMPVSQKTLKILCLSGAFCLVLAVYETLEYMLCYNEEKKEHRKAMRRAGREREDCRRTGGSPGTSAQSQDYEGDAADVSETACLLQGEEIPMDTFPTSTVESDPGEVTLFERSAREGTPDDSSRSNSGRESHQPGACRAAPEEALCSTQDAPVGQGPLDGSGDLRRARTVHTRSAWTDSLIGSPETERSLTSSASEAGAGSSSLTPTLRSPHPQESERNLQSSSGGLGADKNPLHDGAGDVAAAAGDDEDAASDDNEETTLIGSASKSSGKGLLGVLGRR